MSCDGEACVLKEADDHLGSSLQAGELKTHQSVQVVDGSG
jgi:hypothetical protein